MVRTSLGLAVVSVAVLFATAPTRAEEPEISKSSETSAGASPAADGFELVQADASSSRRAPSNVPADNARASQRERAAGTSRASGGREADQPDGGSDRQGRSESREQPRVSNRDAAPTRGTPTRGRTTVSPERGAQREGSRNATPTRGTPTRGRAAVSPERGARRDAAPTRGTPSRER